jgi:hypothetical protein
VGIVLQELFTAVVARLTEALQFPEEELVWCVVNSTKSE